MKIVQKYGGSSLADEECLRRVAARIQRDAQDGNVLVVVSAQGKTTDALTEKYRQVSSEFPSRESDALLVCGELASNLPDPEIEPTSFASPTLASGLFTIAPPGKHHMTC